MAVAGVLVLAWAWMQNRVRIQALPTPTITSDSPLTKDQSIVEHAKALADKGDLEAAHQKLAECTTDTIQSSADYQSVEARWGKDLLDRADREPDLNARREMAKRVEANKTTAVDLRNRAQVMLRDIETQQTQSAATLALAASATSPSVVSAQPRDASPHPSVAQRDPQTTTPRRPPPQPDPAPPPLPTSKPDRSKTDQAREVLLTNPGLAKSLLMPVVASGKGTPEDVRVLKAACEGLKDRACLDFLRGR
jgi:hypothetical protein